MNIISMEHSEIERIRKENERVEERRRMLYAQKRRRLLKRRRFIFSFALSCVLMLCTAGLFSLKSNAVSENPEIKYKYYTKITIQSGDTLWSIADSYMDDTMYSSKREYISEVKKINHLGNSGDIQSGQEIIVPYYSTEFRL